MTKTSASQRTQTQIHTPAHTDQEGQLEEATGASRCSLHSEQKLPRRVLMVTGIYPTEQRPHSGTFIKSQVESLIEAGLDVEIIHPGRGPVLLRYISASCQVFLKTLTGKFDVIHGHYGQWCLFACMQWNTPIVASFLGSDVLGNIKSDGTYSKSGNVVIHLCRWLSRYVDCVIVKSEEMKDVIGRNDVFVIPNGVDFSLFKPMPRQEVREALGWTQDRYYILFGNNPALRRKNFTLAQSAIEHLQRKGIHAELVVANGLPHTTVAQYLNACNALILPSIAEGSPNIVKEAMACNIPVVATDVGDVAQVIGKTEGCAICPPEPEAFAVALEKALKLPGPTTGREDIQHLNRSLVARQILEVYKKAIEKKTDRGNEHA